MMHTIREAIDAGARDVCLVNGTSISLPDIGQGMFGIQPPKCINGKSVYRHLFCIIHESRRTRGLEDLSKRKMGYPFRSNEYNIPEREINLFISQNGGIDEYNTMYFVNQYDY